MEALQDFPPYVRNNPALLRKLADDPSLVESVKGMYSRINLPATWKNDVNLKLPKTYDGPYGPITYNEFGFPILDSYSPGRQTFFKPSPPAKLVGNPRADDNLAAMEWLKEKSGLIDGVDFKQLGDGRGSVLFKINGKWEKCTWHHHENGQTMIPVPSDLHTNLSHSGGVSTKKHGVNDLFN